MPPQEGQLMWGTHIYVPSAFNPQGYGLRPVEVRALLAQLPAVGAMTNLYFLQNGGMPNLRLWNVVNATAGSGNEAVQDYRRRVSAYGGPFDSVGKRFEPGFSKDVWNAAQVEGQKEIVSIVNYDTLIGDDEAPTGADVFVNETRLTKEQVAKWGQQELDAVNKGLSQAEKWAMKHPLLNTSTK